MTFVIRMSSGVPLIARMQLGAHAEDMAPTQLPTLRTKLSFWLLLSVLSVAIAEVSVASAPFAFVNPFETLFLTLFYGSHLLVFAWLTFKRGWPTLTALWLAGVLFGLYEFYITKVLWSPPWGDTISFAHVDVLALIVLAFFWHPFMAFIFPLSIAEAIGTRSWWVSSQLPPWFTGASRRTTVIAFVIAALTFGLATTSPDVAIVSTVSAMAAVGLTSWWWRRKARHCAWTLRDLLPNDRQGKRITLVLAAQYLLLAPLMNADSIPPLLGHVVVLLFYGGFALLFRSSLAESSASAWDEAGRGATWPRRRLIQWAGALLLLSVLGSLGRPEIGFVIVWLGATIAGTRMFVGTLRRVVRGSARTPQPADHDGDPVRTS